MDIMIQRTAQAWTPLGLTGRCPFSPAAIGEVFSAGLAVAAQVRLPSGRLVGNLHLPTQGPMGNIINEESRHADANR